jgi:hypothetical protein
MPATDKKLERGPLEVDRQKFVKLVDTLCARPSIVQDFIGLVNFLEGYIVGVTDNRGTRNHPFGNFLTLLEHANGFSHPAWGWPRHYLHAKGTDERAIRDFPAFLRQSLDVPEARVMDLFKDRRNLSRTPPDSPQTAKLDPQADRQ